MCVVTILVSDRVPIKLINEPIMLTTLPLSRRYWKPTVRRRSRRNGKERDGAQDPDPGIGIEAEDDKVHQIEAGETK